MAREDVKATPTMSASGHTRELDHQTAAFLTVAPVRLLIAVALLLVILSYAYQAIQAPPPKICGSPGGPPVTAPRIKLRDGRHLAYKEHGIPKETATYKIVFVHGYDSCRHDVPVANTLSPELFEELGVHIVSFDRPGYGESDPHPLRTPKSIAMDIEELADQLELGSKFYVVGFSMGGQVVWGCLQYIPHRLAGATLIAPVVNYWWNGFPANLSRESYGEQLRQDQWTLRAAHYTPLLTYFWNTQKLFPASSVTEHKYEIYSRQDLQLLGIAYSKSYEVQIRQQGEYEFLHRDLMVGFGSWDFSPLEMENPFPSGEVSVHLWHGDEDRFVPVSLQRYIGHQLSWIDYHELRGAGHMFPYADGMSDLIIKSLLLK